MGYGKLIDKEYFYEDIPGPVKDHNHDGRGDNPQVPGDGQGGVGNPPGPGPDGEKSNREGGEHH